MHRKSKSDIVTQNVLKDMRFDDGCQPGKYRDKTNPGNERS